MKASLGGQIAIALGGLVSATILAAFIWKVFYITIRYIQWINMTIIYVARQTGTPLPQSLIDQYHTLPLNGESVEHLSPKEQEEKETLV